MQIRSCGLYDGKMVRNGYNGDWPESAKGLQHEMADRKVLMTIISIWVFTASVLGSVVREIWLVSFCFTVIILIVPMFIWNCYQFFRAKSKYRLAVIREVHGS